MDQMMTDQIWKTAAPDPAQTASLCRELDILPPTAAVMVNRGLKDAAAARSFFNTALSRLRPPFAMKDLMPAARRAADAVRRREKILIFGDFDVDGVTATVVLTEFLRTCGADVDFFIPHRIRDGYDFQASHVTGRALPSGVDLIITVDCGSTRREAVRTALDSGMDVIITDHHTVSDPPDAVPVVNPRQGDCAAGFEYLAGVGVAFCLAAAIRSELRDDGWFSPGREPNLKSLCDLVALGTIADLVPLVRDNRIFCAAGMAIMNRDGQAGPADAGRPGVAALIRSAGLTPPLISEDVAFRLAPRINACGRIAEARTAADLLLTRNPAEAERLAGELGRLNRVRQETESRLLETILDRLERRPEARSAPAIVLHQTDWHEGVLGIVAARLTNLFFRPAVLISVRNGIGRGSCRSIPGVDIHKALTACAGHLVKFGGHPAAAGLTIRPEAISAFSLAFQEQIAGQSASDAVKIVETDLDLSFRWISDRLVTELERLEPFGEGNPAPCFSARSVDVCHSRVFSGRHRKMELRQRKGGPPVEAMFFNAPAAALSTDHFDRLAFRLSRRRFNGRESIQAIISDFSI